MFNSGFNPYFNTSMTTQSTRTPWGRFNSFQMSNELSAMGKGALFGNLTFGLANIFLNKGYQSPFAGLFGGQSGYYNNSLASTVEAGNQNNKANLQAFFPNCTIQQNPDKTYNIVDKNGDIIHSGSYEDLQQIKVDAGEAKKTKATEMGLSESGGKWYDAEGTEYEWKGSTFVKKKTTATTATTTPEDNNE